jgi:hypothetical protein
LFSRLPKWSPSGSTNFAGLYIFLYRKETTKHKLCGTT